MTVRQESGGIRVSQTTATLGGTIEVDVATSDATIELVDASGQVQTFATPPNKHLSLAVPAVPAGSFLTIRIGHGARAQSILIEVVSTPP